MKTLGTNGPLVSPVGLGAMGMSELYGPADRGESLATLRAALDAGINLIDTADFYGMGHNELLIAEAMVGRKREDAVLSVKFGAMRDPAGGWAGYQAGPTMLKNALVYSLRRLNVEYIDIYRPVRLDPNTPIEETMGALAQMVKAGYIRHIGLSEVNAETIRRAAAIHPVCDVQIEYSLATRMVEANILPTCRELGIGITAYGILGRGLFSGHWTKERSDAKEYRSMLPRFRGENLEHNLALVEKIRHFANEQGVTVAQILIAWAMERGTDVAPLLGIRTRARLEECLGALDFTLSEAHIHELEALMSSEEVAGTRYPRGYLMKLDSERVQAEAVS